MGGATRGAAAGLRTVYSSGPVAGLTDAQLLERFVARHDDGASFEALLTRHGPMVLGVCRSLLRDEHAANDAFQATFLVLVRKARSVQAGDSLGRWLYGVARKVAVRSRSDAARRQSREQSGIDAPEPVVIDEGLVEKADLSAALHDELSRLPEKARAAIVMCHLEGLTHDEAARRLGWPVGTVRSRLARGRDRLRERLSRRGFTPATPLAGLLPAMVPERLLIATKLTAARVAAGEAIAAGMVPASVLTLTTGVLHAMTFTHLKFAAGLILSASLIGLSGAGVHAYQDRDKDGSNRSSEGSQSEKKAPSVDSLRAPDAKQVPAILFDQTGKATETPEELNRRRLTRNNAAVDRLASDPFSVANPSAKPNALSPQEYAAQIELSRAVVARNAKLQDRGAIANDEVLTGTSALKVLEGRLAGLIEDLEDNLELLQVRLVAKKAESKQVDAKKDRAFALIARNKRVEARLPGAVSSEEVAKTESEAAEATADYEVKQAGVTEIEVLIKQTTRKLNQYKSLLKKGDLQPF